jgi:hypothetical protein
MMDKKRRKLQLALGQAETKAKPEKAVLITPKPAKPKEKTKQQGG